MISGLSQAGDSASLLIPLPSALTLPANAEYLKYQTGEGWRVFIDQCENRLTSAILTDQGQCPAIDSDAHQLGLKEGAACIQLTLVDGGPYDADGLINTQIEDPSVISANLAPTLEVQNDESVNELSDITITANTIDPQGTALTYLWTQTQG